MQSRIWRGWKCGFEGLKPNIRNQNNEKVPKTKSRGLELVEAQVNDYGMDSDLGCYIIQDGILGVDIIWITHCRICICYVR